MYTDLSESQLKQSINAEQAFQAYQHSKARAHAYRGGKNAMYAYKAQAGVHFQDDITATLDLDFLWDSRKRISLAVQSDLRQEGLIGILKKADPSFALLPGQACSAANASGYIVDLIKRMPHLPFEKMHTFPELLRQPNLA